MLCRRPQFSRIFQRIIGGCGNEDGSLSERPIDAFSAAIPFVLSCLIYLGFGVSQTYQEIHMALGEQFAQEFVMSWWSAVPAIILLGVDFLPSLILKNLFQSVC